MVHTVNLHAALCFMMPMRRTSALCCNACLLEKLFNILLPAQPSGEARREHSARGCGRLRHARIIHMRVHMHDPHALTAGSPLNTAMHLQLVPRLHCRPPSPPQLPLVLCDGRLCARLFAPSPPTNHHISPGASAPLTWRDCAYARVTHVALCTKLLHGPCMWHFARGQGTKAGRRCPRLVTGTVVVVTTVCERYPRLLTSKLLY
jgi:hypothetical protein